MYRVPVLCRVFVKSEIGSHTYNYHLPSATWRPQSNAHDRINIIVLSYSSVGVCHKDSAVILVMKYSSVHYAYYGNEESSTYDTVEIKGRGGSNS